MPLRMSQTHPGKECLIAGPLFCSRCPLTSFRLSSSLQTLPLPPNFSFRAILSKRSGLVFLKHFSQITGNWGPEFVPSLQGSAGSLTPEGILFRWSFLGNNHAGSSALGVGFVGMPFA